MPEASVCGIAAGLHAVVRLPGGADETAILETAARRGLAFNVLGAYEIEPRGGPPTLILGYARNTEPVIELGVREMVKAIRAAG
jgi:GntR family transcriptional regulator/MocR family aminotransferase